MNPYAIYALGVVTLPVLGLAIFATVEVTGRVKRWWRRRHTQVSYSIRCDRCGRMFTFWSKRLTREQFDAHACELREFMPTNELIPDKYGTPPENREEVNPSVGSEPSDTL